MGGCPIFCRSPFFCTPTCSNHAPNEIALKARAGPGALPWCRPAPRRRSFDRSFADRDWYEPCFFLGCPVDKRYTKINGLRSPASPPARLRRAIAAGGGWCINPLGFPVHPREARAFCAPCADREHKPVGTDAPAYRGLPKPNRIFNGRREFDDSSSARNHRRDGHLLRA